MPLDLNTYLESALDSFVHSAIQRVAHSGIMQYDFVIRISDIKAATDRQRLHDSVYQQCIGFFENYGLGATYTPEYQSFNVGLDLSLATLRPQQAEWLAQAINTYRVEHG